MIDFATAYPNSRKIFESRAVPLVPDGPVATVQVPMREVALAGGEAPVRLYDTSGPAGYDVRGGLPKLREPWIEARRAADLPRFACGVGLHLGRVYYGNIGTPERLEFSVIGVAANKAARIEALCKETGQDVVLSSAFVAELGAPCRSLGRFALRGVEEPEEVFALS